MLRGTGNVWRLSLFLARSGLESWIRITSVHLYLFHGSAFTTVLCMILVQALSNNKKETINIYIGAFES